MRKFGPIIGIRNLTIHTLIGVYPEERESIRELVFNIELELDQTAVPKSDNLCDTVDYASVASQLTLWASGQKYYLIEQLAYHSILKIFEIDGRIKSVFLEVFKDGCIPNAEGAAIKLSYEREELLNNEYTGIHKAPGLQINSGTR